MTQKPKPYLWMKWRWQGRPNVLIHNGAKPLKSRVVTDRQRGVRGCDGIRKLHDKILDNKKTDKIYVNCYCCAATWASYLMGWDQLEGGSVPIDAEKFQTSHSDLRMIF